MDETVRDDKEDRHKGKAKLFMNTKFRRWVIQVHGLTREVGF